MELLVILFLNNNTIIEQITSQTGNDGTEDV